MVSVFFIMSNKCLILRISVRKFVSWRIWNFQCCVALLIIKSLSPWPPFDHANIIYDKPNNDSFYKKVEIVRYRACLGPFKEHPEINFVRNWSLNHLVIDVSIESLFSFIKLSVTCHQHIFMLIWAIILHLHFTIQGCHMKILLGLYHIERKP